MVQLAGWCPEGVCLNLVITLMLGHVIKGPDNPINDSCLLHPMMKGMEVLSLSTYPQSLKAEEHLINIKKQKTS